MCAVVQGMPCERDGTDGSGAGHGADRPAAPEPAVVALAEQLRPRLTRISHVMRRETNALPVTQAQSAVLGQVYKGPLRMSELARAEGVRLPSMTQIVSRMMKLGWVTRPGGVARGNEVVITAEGRAVFDEVSATRTDTLARKLAALDEDERAAVTAALPALDGLFGTPGP